MFLVNEPKVKSTEPEWKKAAEEKRQRLRSKIQIIQANNRLKLPIE